MNAQILYIIGFIVVFNLPIHSINICIDLRSLICVLADDDH